MDTTIADLRRIRAPLMQYRRIRELLQFVRDSHPDLHFAVCRAGVPGGIQQRLVSIPEGQTGPG